MAYHGKYKLPADLMSDDGLNRDEKIHMLKQWRDDKKAILRASSEGMHGNDRPDILKQINKALISLA